MAIRWSEDLAVGVAQIDEQHKALFAQVDRLLTACNQRQGRAAVGEIIGFLEKYVVSHFGDEEAYMARFGYPEAEAHRQHHRGFVQSFGELKRQFEAEGPGLALVLTTNQLVVEWLGNHIRRVDRKLGGFLKGRL